MSQLQVGPLPQLGEHYDLVVTSLGYEMRARYIAERFGLRGRRNIAWAFERPRVLSFDDNAKWFATAKFELVGEEEGSPAMWLERASAALSAGSPLRVCVDISSTTRGRLAAWVEALQHSGDGRDVEADFVYAQAEFIEPPETTATNTYAGPVSPHFAGWTADPELESVLLLGLGYEHDRAIGAVEYIEPGEVIAFEPVSREARFTAALQRANEPVWALRPTPKRVVYDVETPFATFMLLHSTVSRAVTRSRPIILPFGPKVFSLCSLLAGLFHPTAAVWRVSAGADEIPVQRIPAGEPIGLRTKFAHSPSPASSKS